MIPSWANKEVYKQFDNFLQKSLLNNDSYITNNIGIFSIDNLNSCVTAFVDNLDTSDRNFDAKINDQFIQTPQDVKEVFAHFIWLWSLPTNEMRSWGKKNVVERFLGENYNGLQESVFLNGGIGSAGQRHKFRKPFEISYLLLLFREVKNNLQEEQLDNIDAVKKYIETICRELYHNNSLALVDERLKKVGNEYLAMHHILLHLCNPDKYEAIAAQKHKDAIVSTFFSLLDKDSAEDLWDDIDDSIYNIRKKLCEALDDNVNFYDKNIQDAWNFEDDKNDTSIETLFEYKKAIIFYGPPGTSKAYSANYLAEILITKQYFRNRENIKEYFQNSRKIFEDHIHHLQLHSNYNYEDFIAGIHIEDKSTVVKPGYLLNLIEKVKDDKLPHVLILDEINRTDISRLFGELFSALEYREKKIKLSVGNLEIALPPNLYFIGTMNEIDFSLERIDFALRRRFLWQFKGFNKDTLWSIIQQKRNKLEINISDVDVETFINRCECLNKEVSVISELGNNYQIGHTFFAEIVDIYKSLKSVHSGRLYFLNQPVNILWEISISPILQAFLGNMDSESKDKTLKKLKQLLVCA